MPNLLDQLERTADSLRAQLRELEHQLTELGISTHNTATLVATIEEKISDLKTEMETLNREFKRVKRGLEEDLEVLRGGDVEGMRKAVEDHRRKWEEELRALEEFDMEKQMALETDSMALEEDAIRKRRQLQVDWRAAEDEYMRKLRKEEADQKALEEDDMDKEKR